MFVSSITNFKLLMESYTLKSEFNIFIPPYEFCMPFTSSRPRISVVFVVFEITTVPFIV
jgi:hypothetical protein